jgi:hypothetical protein
LKFPIETSFYLPIDRGLEGKLKEKLDWWLEKMKKEREK